MSDHGSEDKHGIHKIKEKVVGKLKHAYDHLLQKSEHHQEPLPDKNLSPVNDDFSLISDKEKLGSPMTTMKLGTVCDSHKEFSYIVRDCWNCSDSIH